MKCKKTEKSILRSFDGLLKNKEKKALEKHLKSCPRCQRIQREYQNIIGSLRKESLPETKPYFWERLQPRLQELKKDEPWFIWKRWSLRAIPLSIIIVTLLGTAAFLFLPPQKEELSQSEVLLLRNTNPIQETKTFFEEEKIERKNLKLIFLAMEDKNSIRRH